MKNIKKLFFVLIILVIAFGVFYFIKFWIPNYKAKKYQASIQNFYNPPSDLSSYKPGSLIKTEQINISVPGGGTAYRIMYVSQLPNGQIAASSGLVFIPSAKAPSEGRKIIAWAHGTLGFGNECTPSRSQNPLEDTNYWLESMMQKGWVVVATDYVGIGTPGTPYYLIGQSESNDVLNSIRAIQNLDIANAGDEFIVWGHSQGGHSALFTSIYSKSYAPELKLVAVAAAAPATELSSLFSELYNNAVAWAIGPDTSVSWPQVYKNIPLKPILTKAGYKNYNKLAYGCVIKEIGELELKSVFKDKFFQSDPMANEIWYQTAQEQTPPISEINVPIYIAQGLVDTVVLPDTTALLVKKACALNKVITTNWFGDTNHTKIAEVAGPEVVDWVQDRFNNIPATNNCNQNLPVEPANEPPAPNK